MLKTIIITALLTAFGATAVAETADKTYEIRYSTAELQSVSGLKDVLTRIEDISKELCADEFSGARWVFAQQAYKRCLREVSRDLIAKTGSQRLSDLYEGKAAPIRLVQRPPYD